MIRCIPMCIQEDNIKMDLRIRNDEDKVQWRVFFYDDS
jgi:hypothetical protein